MWVNEARCVAVEAIPIEKRPYDPIGRNYELASGRSGEKLVNGLLNNRPADLCIREYTVKQVVDEQPALSQRFGVMSIPTVVYFKGGKVVDQTIGALPKEEIKRHIEKLL